MKWFNKLFRKKCAKISESKSSKINCMSRTQEPETQEVFALTTSQNFRSDQLKDFAVDSDWVILSREEMLKPLIQEKLARPEKLTEHCRTLVEKSRHKKKVKIISRSPLCHCNDIDLEDSITGRSKLCSLKRVFDAVANFWCRVCKRVKNCICVKRIRKIELSGMSDETSTYKCWYFIYYTK